MKVHLPGQMIVSNEVSVVGSCGAVAKMSQDMKCEIKANTDE
jgi:hypothetical protein